MKKNNRSRVGAAAPNFIDRILDAIDLKWSVLKAPVAYKADLTAPMMEVEAKSVLFRSDTKQELAVVSSSHQVWQPREIVEFYLSLAAFYGLAVESMGYVQGGRKLWALLDTGEQAMFSSGRSARAYLLLTTPYDSTLAAQAQSLCLLQPGSLALPATPAKPIIVRIARSPDFLTPGDLAGIGELMRECISFPGFLEDLARHTPSEAQVKQATAAALGARGDDPSVPSARALNAVLTSLREARERAATPSSLHLLYALAHVSDARDQKRRPEDLIHSSWFGAGAKRKQFAVRALARMLRLH
ncbi:DUF932 domain-containing protein [Ramlibacter ginsenosidimutans]|uniref:DUF932 domain-containing protein n=1 Tax=Ramlibacter ginsenosidimutans TaxID=502333 RepID=A0A934TYI4_9BURK|nr:DUF932 domain-containing protein [Ramlibacter ginsenosidimutans]MBK6009536.1 DUF932 domain-containing protein [Ramlibacter ginsenosidimutans]